MSISTAKHKLTNKLKEESFSVDDIGKYYLLLSFDFRSFDFAIVDSTTNKCKLVEEYVLTGIASYSDLVNQFEQIFSSHHVLNAGFWKKVRVNVKNQKFTFVPNSLFNQSKAESYISFSNDYEPEEESISVYKHISTDMVNAFAFSKEVEKFINNKYPKNKLEITHQTSAFIEGALRKNKVDSSKKVFLTVDSEHLLLVVVDNKKLQFCNRFEYTSTEDFIYFIMLVYHELELNVEIDHITIYGEISPSTPYYDIIHKYIRNSSFGKRPTFLNFSYHFDEVFDHKFFTTCSSYLCE